MSENSRDRETSGLKGSRAQGSKVRRWLRRQSRTHAAIHNFPWYRAGYIQALDDIDRTGLRATTDASKREAADRALKRWIDE